MESEIIRTIRNVLAAGDLMMLQQLRDFEVHLTSLVGTSHAVGVSNCTDGLRRTLELASLLRAPVKDVDTSGHTTPGLVEARRFGSTPIVHRAAICSPLACTSPSVTRSDSRSGSAPYGVKRLALKQLCDA